MLIPVFLRKVTKYGANGEKRMHQLSFPCRHLTLAPTSTPLRTNAPALTHLLQHFHASAPPHSRTCPATLAHLRLRRCAPATPLAHNRATTLTHLRHHTRAPSSSIYTHWRPPLRTFVLPSLFRSLSESIRIYPSLSDILREISMGPD